MLDVLPTLIRLLQLLWILLVTALIGNVIALTVSTTTSGRAAVNFAMFVAVLSWLAALFGLVATRIERLAHAVPPLVQLGIDGTAAIFTFLGAIVLAARLGGVNCANPGPMPDSWIAYGSDNDEKRCRTLQAGTTFMWFLFLSFVASLLLLVFGLRRSSGSIRSGPHMSQVRV